MASFILIIYNSAQDRPINLCLLNKILSYQWVEWSLFSNMKFKDVINKYSTLFTLHPNYILWNHLKKILNDAKCCSNIVNITNTCINLRYWLTHFKKSSSIIISKLNKSSYNILKFFHLIVLLNMLGKLIEKAISSRL